MSSSRRNSNNGRVLTDEDLARALQRQYEREFQESQQQQQQQRQEQPRRPSSSSSSRRQSGSGGGGVTVAEQRSRTSSTSNRASSSSRPAQQPQRQMPPPPPPPPPPAAVTTMSDEEYARSLMLEEERARAAAQRALARRQQNRSERRSQQQQLEQQQQQPFTNTIVVLPSAPVETQSMRGGRGGGGGERRGSSSFVNMSDAELAQQMMAQQEAQARKQQHGNNNNNNNSFNNHHPYGIGTTPLTSRESSLVSQEIDDEELAMRLQQEMRDEEIARQIQMTEADRITAQNAQRLAELQQQQRLQQQQQQQQAPKRGCTSRRVCSFLTSTLILGAAASVMIYYFLIMGNDLPSWIPSPEDFIDDNPFDPKNPSEANKWENDGRGITLEVLNALNDYWHPYFNQAVQDWDNGYPDSLTLVTSIREVEPDCTTVNGKVKVCNGNYGNTHWKGINEVLIDREGKIFASSAKMNEYYLGAPGDPDQMQYTMCHEIGHAWGLPHTDESFTNKDLGNCMDYTNNPSNNKTPDITNYQFLYALYGLVPGAAPYTPPTEPPVSDPSQLAATTTTADGAASVTDKDGEDLDQEENDDGPPDDGDAKSKDKFERGQGRRRKTRRMAHDEDEPLAEWLQAAVDAAKASLEEMNHSNQQDAVAAGDATTSNTSSRGRWRLLQQAPHGESHEIELEHGYRFQVHKLYA